jgi:NTE family protein
VAAEIEEVALTVNKVWIRRNFLSDLNLPWPHGGLLQGNTIGRFLRVILKDRTFSDLLTPFACVATDIITGDPVVLKEGLVWQAVRGSLSLPLIFQPYRLGPNMLVDGGLVNPVPTSVIASMGADILVAINLTNKVSEKKVSMRRMGIFPSTTPGLFHILLKMIYTMQYQVVSSRTDLSHVMIQPDTRNFSWVDFHKAKQIIPLGVEAAEEILPKLKARIPYFSAPIQNSKP